MFNRRNKNIEWKAGGFHVNEIVAAYCFESTQEDARRGEEVFVTE